MPAPVIDPALKEFIDQVLVPMLVREAKRDIKSARSTFPEIHVAPALAADAQSEPVGSSS
jgi:hypothetical protein